MIPLRDSIRTRHFPVVNTILVVLNVAVFILEATSTPAQRAALIWAFALVPARLRPEYLAMAGYWPLITLITSAFLHGSVLHIIGNLIYLWVFGDNVEDLLGRWGYLGFYLGCAVAAGVAHMAFNPTSAVPTLGASGAIAGVLGAYLVTYPKAKVLTLVPIGFFVPAIRVPAWVYLPIWFAIQLTSGVLTLRAGSQPAQGVAWWAHVAGFLTGAVLVMVFGRRPNAERQEVR